MRDALVGIAVGSVLLASLLWIAPVRAQVQGSAWSQPYLLSTGAGRASEAYCVADQYGYVHCFWTETLYEDQRIVIQYARFDGETWTTPNAIHVTDDGIENIAPAVDRQGILHIAWAEGLTGPAYYTYAPASDAISARAWAPPVRIDVPARTLRLRVDSTGSLHILFINQIEEPGVYYIRSQDQGATWSAPIWLDPDILADHVPGGLNFELDENDGLHAVWFYGALDPGARADWVRYAHSLDGGETWSLPYLIDQSVDEDQHYLTNASPIMAVQGRNVHIIWAAGDLPYRYHRYSTDAGQTWGVPQQIFGALHGQAFDGLAVDGTGRIHFIGQIRYPQGIYHAQWDQTGWTTPSLVYLLALEGDDMGDHIHAHHTLPVVRAGNQLVITFGDPPADEFRRLFAMHRILDDVAPLTSVPTPVPTATHILAPSATLEPPTPNPTLAATAPFFSGSDSQPLGTVPASELALRAAMVPTLLLLAVTVVVRVVYKLKQ